MLRVISKDELKEVLRKHELWLNNQEGGERAKLFLTKLVKRNLSNLNLAYADLFGSNLASANLTNTNLHGANLVRANLSKANLTNTNLTDAMFN